MNETGPKYIDPDDLQRLFAELPRDGVHSIVTDTNGDLRIEPPLDKNSAVEDKNDSSTESE